MKKVLLATLAVFTFIGLTGCGSKEKKLSATEAQQQIKAAQENTAKELKEKKGIKAKAEQKVTASVEAKNIKIDSSLGAKIPTITAASASLDVTGSEALSYDEASKKASASATIKGGLKANYAAGSTTIKYDWKADATGEAYIVDSSTKTNIYAKGSANIPEELKALIGIKADAKLGGQVNLKVEKGDEDDEDEQITIEELITKIDFDDFINDWSIFSMKGSTIIIDCSNLKAFNFGDEDDEDEDIQATLAKAGLDLKISKFEIKLNKKKAISDIDFNMSLKGTVDLSKLGLDKWDIIDLVEMINENLAEELEDATINGISGTVSVDYAVSLGVDINYGSQTITVPTALTNLPEIDLKNLFRS